MWQSARKAAMAKRARRDAHAAAQEQAQALTTARIVQAKELRENTSRSVARARARSPARRVHNAAQERSAVLFREPGRLG